MGKLLSALLAGAYLFVAWQVIVFFVNRNLFSEIMDFGGPVVLGIYFVEALLVGLSGEFMYRMLAKAPIDRTRMLLFIVVFSPFVYLLTILPWIGFVG